MAAAAEWTSTPTRDREWRSRGVVSWVAASLVFGGVLARLWPRQALWLDEAQSVAIASLSLGEIPGALRQDGAPPLYYIVLHVWIGLFGDGDVAVRSLSMVCSLVTLTLLVVVADRWAGRRVAGAVAVLAATNPFVIRYATETRMYSMVMLEVVVGLIVLDACLRHSNAVRIAVLGVATALLLYTHYWSMYLVAVVAAVLACAAVRRSTWSARSALAGIGVGVVLWLPWMPTLLFQSRHTSTPWASPAGPFSLGAVFDVGIRNSGSLPVALAVVTATLLALGVWRGAALAGRALTVRWLGAVIVGTLLAALLGSSLSDSAYAPRYTAVVVPLSIIVTAAGAVSLRTVRMFVVLTVAGLVGLVLAVDEAGTPRTRSSAFVAPLRQAFAAGDVLVYCPDQLGPAADRLVTRAGLGGGQELVFPPGRGPDRVNWIDYASRHALAQPQPFAAALDAAAGGSTIWLVWSDSYPPTQAACRGLLAALRRDRPAGCELVADDPALADHGTLWRFEPAEAADRRSVEDRGCPA